MERAKANGIVEACRQECAAKGLLLQPMGWSVNECFSGMSEHEIVGSTELRRGSSNISPSL
jgi:hypothetical protein